MEDCIWKQIIRKKQNSNLNIKKLFEENISWNIFWSKK